MTLLYNNRGYWWRNTISMVVLALIAVYGAFEIWRASNAPTGTDTEGYLFGFGFIGGSIWGGWQLIEEARDRVMGFARDAGGRTLVTLWRPFSIVRLTGDASALANWRLHISIGKRNLRTYYIQADHKDHPRPLVFDLRRGTDLAGLKLVAPDAVAEFLQKQA